MNLATGRRINRNRYSELPMPNEVINRVHILARRSKANRDLTFCWRDGNAIDDGDDDNSDDDSDYDPTRDDAYSDSDNESNDDSDYEASSDSDSDDDDGDGSATLDPLDIPIAGVNADDDEPPNNDGDGSSDAADSDDDSYDENDNNENDLENDNNDENENELENDNDDAPQPISDDEGVGESEDEDDANAGVRTNQPSTRPNPGVETVDEHCTETDVNASMNERYGARTGRYKMQPRRKPHRNYLCEDETQFRVSDDGNDFIIAPQDYSHQHTTLEHFAMTKHSIKKGLKIFGKDGETAVISEMQQLHDMECIEPKSARMLTREEKAASLRYLMFLKQKHCVRIKGRGCADGRKQRLYKTKAETSAPTVAIESVFLTSVIDAKEERHVISLNIPGAFMQTDIDERIYVRLEGPMALLLAKVNPCMYTKYLSKERGQDVIYVKLKKALHGGPSKLLYCFGRTSLARSGTWDSK
jgi:hypothetical protein